MIYQTKNKKLLLAIAFGLLVGMAPWSISFASTIVGHSNTASLGSGLVGYWSMDGSSINWTKNQITDLSGNNNTGTLVSMSTTTSPVAGKIGGALNFNGSTLQYVDAGNSSALKPGSGSYTMAGWIKTSKVGVAGDIFGAYDTSSMAFVYLSASGQLVFYLRSPTHFDVSSATGVISNTNWHYIVVSIDRTANLARIYKDGVQIQTGSISGMGAVSPTTDFKIGNVEGSGNTFNGSIDDVRIYNRALSAQEVQQLYAQGSVTVAHSNTVSLSSGLVGYWTLDGSKTNWATGITQDSSGNGNNAVLTNLSTTTSPVAGKVGSALYFPGVSGTQYFAATVKGTITTFSISFWQYMSAIQGGNNSIALNFGNTSFYTDAGGSQYRVVNNPFGCSSSLFGSVSNSDYLNRWRYITFTLQGTTMSVYRDGVFQASCSTSGSPNTSTNPILQIGNDFAGRDFIGKLDDVRIYNRALSAQEVKQLYAQGAATIDNANPVSLSSGLIGYWPMDGNTTNWTTDTTNDMSGNGRTGNLINMSTTTSPVAGKIGGALNFNGANQITTTKSYSYSANAPWTESVWANVSNYAPGAGSYPTMVTCGTGQLELRLQSNKGWPEFGDGSFYATWTTPIPKNTWHHFVGVFDGTNYYMYVDGVLRATTPGTSNSFTCRPNIGNRGNQFFGGSLDDVRIYNRALSAQEVAQLYAMGK